MTDYSKTEINFLLLARMARRARPRMGASERECTSTIVFFTPNMFVLKISSPFS